MGFIGCINSGDKHNPAFMKMNGNLYLVSESTFRNNFVHLNRQSILDFLTYEKSPAMYNNDALCNIIYI